MIQNEINFRLCNAMNVPLNVNTNLEENHHFQFQISNKKPLKKRCTYSDDDFPTVNARLAMSHSIHPWQKSKAQYFLPRTVRMEHHSIGKRRGQ